MSDTDYHQKPISDMTPGELRAYRRDLARAALTGFCAYPDDQGVDASYIWAAVEAMIEHERQEEGEHED